MGISTHKDVYDTSEGFSQNSNSAPNAKMLVRSDPESDPDFVNGRMFSMKITEEKKIKSILFTTVLFLNLKVIN